MLLGSLLLFCKIFLYIFITLLPLVNRKKNLHVLNNWLYQRQISALNTLSKVPVFSAECSCTPCIRLLEVHMCILEQIQYG